jgi:aminomethyltransferase
MPRPSPFHDRHLALSTTLGFKDWSGYFAPTSYDVDPIYEYTAFRKAAGLLDVSPLYKYEVTGGDAARFLSRVCVRGFTKMKPGRVAYTCWCDDDGKVVDDGTVTRLDEDRFFFTAAEAQLRWLQSLSRGFDVTVTDVSETLCALALQGPCARDILKDCTDADLDTLAYFGSAACQLDGKDVRLTRTGYTGDLGYEVWIDSDDALAVYDAIMASGRQWGIRPVGLDALDMVRIEAAYIMAGVDYRGATHCLTAAQKSSPDELGLSWMVNTGREMPFIGKQALIAEREQRAARWAFVGVEWHWDDIEQLYASYGLPPGLGHGASRTALPLWRDHAQVGYVTSSVWSPLLKKQIGIGFINPSFSEVGTVLDIEHTVEFERRTVRCTIVDTPFFDPPRKRSLPGDDQEGERA